MKPWIHPAEGRSRIYYLLQIIACAVVAVVTPIVVILEPTTEHVIIAAFVSVVGIVGVFLGFKALKEPPKVYATKAEEK